MAFLRNNYFCLSEVSLQRYDTSKFEKNAVVQKQSLQTVADQVARNRILRIFQAGYYVGFYELFILCPSL